MDCKKCGYPMRSLGAGMMTCVGYFSPPGHDHDDNCITRGYVCDKCGEYQTVSILRKCPHPECDWVGKRECFCHEGPKVEEWPE